MHKYVASLLIGIFSLVSMAANATHNRAGEITYRYLGTFTYEITVLTYTYTPSHANRDSLYIDWGDGSPLQTVYLDTKVLLPDDMRRNTYVGIHTYPGPGTYTISMEDPNRNGGVVNIPNSIDVPFYIESVLVINPFMGPNNSPQLLSPPVDMACFEQPFYHNPVAYDIDGDSLSFSLIPCKGEMGNPIMNYTYPPADSILTIDPYTGELTWDSPVSNGEFNIAILIEEYRNGIKIGSIIRDMQIDVLACNNNPPNISPLKDTCVIAGDTISFNVSATDPDNQQIIITAIGGPFQVTTSPATFQTSNTPPGFATGTFQWITDCSHIKRSPYHVSFKAQDNDIPVSLFDLESVYIRVISPAPEAVIAHPAGNSIIVSWDKLRCINASGYSVYRRVGPYPFTPGPCETGLPYYAGYTKIGTVNSVHDTVFIDDNNGNGLVHGLNYCYRIVANFPDGAQSIVSEEACAELIRDVPIITNISIRNTHTTQGSSYVAWSKPEIIDTAAAPGPYRYLIYRTVNNSATYSLIDSTNNLTDTTFIDTLQNSVDNEFFYRIDLYNIQPGNRFLIGSTYKASSIFLKLTPGDNEMILSFSPETPWFNNMYTIYRTTPGHLLFDSIGFTFYNHYVDTGLINGQEYCYKVKSTGTYGTVGLVDPIINWSQEVCASPVDTKGPCAPRLKVTTDCIRNTLVWYPQKDPCAKDVAVYEVWYTPDHQSDFVRLVTLYAPSDTVWVHEQDPPFIVGCYTVRGIDSAGNKGAFSRTVCIDIDTCPGYSIPNVFTPNGDNYNDILHPFPYSFIDHIELEIFNRWGQKVYFTNDPDINWDGKNINNGQPCSPGVYYYNCKVFEKTLSGMRIRNIHGIVHLLR